MDGKQHEVIRPVAVSRVISKGNIDRTTVD
jgi:hypothetical protein